MGKGRGKEKGKADGEDLHLSGQQIAVEQAVEQQRRLAEQAAAQYAEDGELPPADKPCTIYALGAGCSGGFLGGLYGFGSKLVMHRGGGRLKAARGEAFSSAKAFATFGGVYAFSSCVVQRLLQREDAVTSGVAGCMTGFVMGIGGGLQSAMASAAMMGAFSLVLDSLGKPAAQASHLQQAGEQQAQGARQRRRRPQPRLAARVPMADLAAELLCPAIPLPGMRCGRQRRQLPGVTF